MKFVFFVVVCLAFVAESIKFEHSVQEMNEDEPLLNKGEGFLQLSAEYGIQSIPQAFSDCATTAENLIFWTDKNCVNRGRTDALCVSDREIMLNNLNAEWDNYCSSPTATPSPSADESFAPVDNCTCVEYDAYKPNVLIFNDLVAQSDSQGSMLIGGSAQFPFGFSIGVYNNLDQGNMLIVGGDLIYRSGEVIGGDIVVGGQADVGTSITNTDVEVKPGNPFDFAGAQAYFEGLSSSLCARNTTGTIEEAFGVLTALRGNGNPEVFALDDTTLAASHTMDLTGISGSATIILNVYGANTDQEFGLRVLTPNGQKVVFNFCSATRLTISNMEIEGALLAPLAAVQGNGGMINGQFVAKSYNGTTQFNDYECLACLDSI